MVQIELNQGGGVRVPEVWGSLSLPISASASSASLWSSEKLSLGMEEFPSVKNRNNTLEPLQGNVILQLPGLGEGREVMTP